MCEPRPPRPRRDRPPGFSLSRTDAAILAACAPATWALWQFVGSFALICPVVLGHFFLFCNVFRVGSRREMLWTLAFIVNVAACQLTLTFSWTRLLLTQTPLTLAIILTTLFSRNYHGLGYSRFRRERDRHE